MLIAHALFHLLIVTACVLAASAAAGKYYLDHRKPEIESSYEWDDKSYGGHIVAQVMRKHGVKWVFTLVGGHISPILVGCKNEGIRVIDVRHEATTVFAADAVARLTGVPGVACVTAGPGLTNTITALKNAQMAQSPVVLIGGATSDFLKGRGSLQDIDQFALVRPHVKWATHIASVSEISRKMDEAFHVASSGVLGPVFVEIPLDVLFPEQMVREDAKKRMPPANSLTNNVVRWYFTRHVNHIFDAKQIELYKPRSIAQLRASESAVNKAAVALRRARRPAIVLGSQACLNQQQIRETVAALETLGIPVFLTGMARGLLGKNNPIQYRHNRKQALKEADVVVLAGITLDFRFGYGFDIGGRCHVIAVNRSSHDLYQNRRPSHAILADAGTFLKQLSYAVIPQSATWKAWHETLRQREETRNSAIHSDAEQPVERYMNPIAVCERVEQALGDNSILIADGGDFISSLAYVVQPRQPLAWLDPGVFGTLGVGAGFALAAKLVNPDAEVWLFWGDGSCGYSIIEYDTFIRHNVPVISVVGNDAAWQQIKRGQVEWFHDDVACSLRYNNYERVLHALDCEGWLVDNIEQLPEVLARAKERASNGMPCMVNCLLGTTDFRKDSLSM